MNAALMHEFSLVTIDRNELVFNHRQKLTEIGLNVLIVISTWIIKEHLKNNCHYYDY